MLFLRFLLLISLALPLAAPSLFASNDQNDKRQELSTRAQQNSTVFYDEMFDERGELRPQYQDVWEVYSQFSHADLTQFRHVSLRDFEKDNALAALPKVLTQSEFDSLKRGVEQRARAALLFLQDHYSGKKSYLQARVIPEEVVNAVIDRSGEKGYASFLKEMASKLSFPYGSDLVRAADGKFYELEFNSGFVGGFGDLRLAREILFERVPEYQKILGDTPSPERFYKTLLDRYRGQMKNPKDQIVLLSVPPYADKEDARLNKIWKDLGVIPVVAGDGQTILNEADGMYLQVSKKRALDYGWIESGAEPSGRYVKRKLGFAIVNAEHTLADPTSPLTKERYWLEIADWALENWDLSPAVKKTVRAAMHKNPATDQVDIDKLIAALVPPEDIRHSGFPGLLDGILSGKISANYTPGAELLSDKELHTYMEDLIRFYLSEEPVIHNLPTDRFYLTNSQGAKTVNQVLLDDTMQNLDQYVVKVVDGRGGVGVWVGSKVSNEEKKSLRDLIAAEPERYIRQKFMHLSTADHDITDLRMLAQVGPLGAGKEAVVVSEVPWARALPIAGNGKVNLSGDGHEMTVFVRKDGSYPKHILLDSLKGRPCSILFDKLLPLGY